MNERDEGERRAKLHSARASRRDVLRLMGGTAGAVGLSPLLSLASCAEDRPTEERPNFIIIMADDMGYGDLGCYGAPDIRTPRIDAMADDGVRFTDFYAAPMCTAARIGLMTGSYSTRAGNLLRTGEGTRVGIHGDEVTLPELLKTRGYSSHLVGKWHLGMNPIFSPLRHGFDSFFGMLTSNGQKPPLMRGEEVVELDPDQSSLTERYTDESLEIIERDQRRPFFLFLSHIMPHVPLSVSDRFRGRSERGLYGDAVECLDWSTGQILDGLARHGLSERTLVVFCSDNGPWLIKGDQGGSARPLRGGKGQVYEGGLRVPCIMRWPGQAPAGTVCRGIGGLIDVLPTFAGLSAAALPADRVLDGRNIWPMARGAPDVASPHEALYFFRGPKLAAMRRGRWKYHLAHNTSGSDARLYDLERDPSERSDVAPQHSDVVAALREEIARFEISLEATRRPAGRVDG